MSADRNPLVFIDNITDSLKAISDHVGEMTFEEYSQSVLVQDAVNMRLQVIGENANKLPVELRDQFTQIPWHKIRGLRNLVSHDYYVLDNRMIWHIITVELPKLKDILPSLQEASTQATTNQKKPT